MRNNFHQKSKTYSLNDIDANCIIHNISLYFMLFVITVKNLKSFLIKQEVASLGWLKRHECEVRTKSTRGCSATRVVVHFLLRDEGTHGRV